MDEGRNIPERSLDYQSSLCEGPSQEGIGSIRDEEVRGSIRRHKVSIFTRPSKWINTCFLWEDPTRVQQGQAGGKIKHEKDESENIQTWESKELIERVRGEGGEGGGG